MGTTDKAALISVTRKEGADRLAKALHRIGYTILSTGGTKTFLEKAGIPVLGVEEYTESPEMFNGRVKSLHPKIHGGLLYRRDVPEDVDDAKNHGIYEIQVVAVNLYPFEETVKKGSSQGEVVENIDIGGPSMIRSAAKNFASVLVLTDPEDYEEAIRRLEEGTADLDFRRKMGAKAFALTAYYDGLIASYFSPEGQGDSRYFSIPLRREGKLRYGENPHQSAELFSRPLSPGVMSSLEQLQGKELSFNNLNDLHPALELAGEIHRGEKKICVALKHATPCGVGLGDTVAEAYDKAYRGDPLSIFGGIVAFNDTVDEETAKAMAPVFLEVVAAPDFTPEALKVFREKKNLRLLKVDYSLGKSEFDYKFLNGKVLQQETDRKEVDEFTVVTRRAPEPKEWDDLKFAELVVKYTRSNGVVVVKDGATLGIGGGQTSRIWALTSIFNNHPDRDFHGAVLGSDAFFPFDDCVKAAGEKGIRAIIQPGGSLRDQDSIEACDERDMAMVFTGIRRFRH